MNWVVEDINLIAELLQKHYQGLELVSAKLILIDRQAAAFADTLIQTRPELAWDLAFRPRVPQ